MRPSHHALAHRPGHRASGAACARSPAPLRSHARIGEATTALPALLPGGGADLPNGWRITPAGKGHRRAGRSGAQDDPLAGRQGDRGRPRRLPAPRPQPSSTAKTHKVVAGGPTEDRLAGPLLVAGRPTTSMSPAANANGEKKIEGLRGAGSMRLSYAGGPASTPKPRAPSFVDATLPMGQGLVVRRAG